MAKQAFKVGDIVHVVNPSNENVEAIFVDNMMDLGAARCDAIIDKVRDPKRRWLVAEIHEGTPSDPDDPAMAALEGCGFKCHVPSMIEVTALVLADDQTMPRKKKTAG